MKKIVLLLLLCIAATSVLAANTLNFYGGNGWVRINTTGQNGTYVCLADGSGCPTNVSGGGGSGYTQWLLSASNTSGTQAMTNNTLLSVIAGNNIIITRNGTSIVINSTASAAAGSGVLQGVRSIDTYLIVVNSTVVNLSLNTTALAINCTSGEYSRWNGSQFVCVGDNTGLTLAQIVANLKSFVNVSTGNQTVFSNGSQLTFTNNAYATWSMPNSGNITLTTSLSSFTTDNLLEGSTNLYYTYSRWLTSFNQANIWNGTPFLNQICWSNGSNCAGVTNGTGGAGNVTGGGVANYIAKWTNATQIEDGIIQDNGLLVNISGNLSVGVGGNNTGNISMAGDRMLLVSATANVTGELTIGGVMADTAGKVLCLKTDKTIGTCSTAVGIGGDCTCG